MKWKFCWGQPRPPVGREGQGDRTGLCHPGFTCLHLETRMRGSRVPECDFMSMKRRGRRWLPSPVWLSQPKAQGPSTSPSRTLWPQGEGKLVLHWAQRCPGPAGRNPAPMQLSRPCCIILCLGGCTFPTSLWRVLSRPSARPPHALRTPSTRPPHALHTPSTRPRNHARPFHLITMLCSFSQKKERRSGEEKRKLKLL